MEERVFADEFRKSFWQEEDFLTFLERREENSEWGTVRSNEIRFYPIEEGHQISGMLEEKLRETGKANVFEDTLEHTRLILKVRDDLYPVRSCAIKTILERARISGNALNKVQKAELAQILNYCMGVASGDALLRFCEDKISAVHGGDASDYAVLETPELFRRTVEYLQDNFSGYTFAGASYDHSIATAVWSLENQDSLLQEYRESLQKHGLPNQEIQLGLRLTTSDTGQSGANLYPMIFFGSEARNIPLGSALKLQHKNKADLAKFDEQLNLLYAQYGKALGNMQSLMDVYVLHPINAMLGVMKRVGVPKKYAMEVSDDFRIQNGNASTLHAALNLTSDTADYEEVIIPADFVVVDEASMVDMRLAYYLLHSLGTGTKVLFVGDANQLPSVGAGNVLNEMIASGIVPVTVLDMVFRQKNTSRIPLNAQSIQMGETKLLYGDDFQFLPAENAAEAADIIKSEFLKQTSIYGVEHTQVLTPFRVKSDAGAAMLNLALQDMINPSADKRLEISFGNRTIRYRDKVMQTKNIETVSNGDIGFVSIVDKDADFPVTVTFSDNRIKEYSVDELNSIDLAYFLILRRGS